MNDTTTAINVTGYAVADRDGSISLFHEKPFRVGGHWSGNLLFDITNIAYVIAPQLQALKWGDSPAKVTISIKINQ